VRHYCVYILSSRSRHLYVGITNNLAIRLAQHRESDHGFTNRYRIDRLVYFESGNDPWAAIRREKQIKGYSRAKKLQLITSMNPAWNDLGILLGLVERSTCG
jgi:putative endonuclease